MGNRIHIIFGHFGSGKTEFSINYALKLREQYNKVAIADLDIINMYFRTREKTEFLESQGIEVYSSSRGANDVLDVPALDPGILKPIQNKDYQTILDCGGDPKGALILRTYSPYLIDTDNIFVVNTNRPETSTPDKIISYIRDIEAMAGISANALLNTTHMLKDTSKEDVLKGHEIVKEVANELGLEFRYNVCKDDVCKELKNDSNVSDEIKEKLFPIELYYRDDWMS